MSMENIDHICINCMREKPDGGICPFCGFDEAQYEPSPHHLTPRSILGGKCLIGRVLGEGGFGITYIGLDLNLDLKLAIKEYYPTGYVTRTNTTTSTVTPFRGEKTEFFTLGRSRFINEAKTLAKFYSLPGIVSVRDFFLENSTAYIVMEFVEGETFKQMLARVGGKMGVSEALELMRPLMRSLAEMHAAGLIHRDISPDNIMVTPENNVKLIDFGAARDYLDSGNRSLSVMLKPGYAPEEQYFSRGQQGPWTDIYALSATIYRAITGVTPQESVERRSHDELKAPSALGVRISPAQEKTLMRGLSVAQEARWQSMPEFYAALFPDDGSLMHIRAQGAPIVANQAKQTNQAKQPTQTNCKKENVGQQGSLLSRWKAVIAKPDSLKKIIPVGIAVVLAIALLISLIGRKPTTAQSLEIPSSSPANAAATNAVAEPTDVSADGSYQVFPLKRRALVPASEQDALFQKALKLLDEGKLAEAMATYDFSQRIDASMIASSIITPENGILLSYDDRGMIKSNMEAFAPAVAVSAESYSVLHSDGTISSVLGNSGTLSQWNNIVKIRSANIDIAGLRANGTLAHTDTSAEFPSDWTDLVDFSYEVFHIVGLKSDGTVVAAYLDGDDGLNTCNVEGWSDIVMISTGSFCTAGLKSDGTVVTTDHDSFDTSDWHDIISINADKDILAGIDVDGNIHLAGYEFLVSGYTRALEWKNIIAIDNGSSYMIGLQADGTVVAFGNGIGDTSAFDQIVGKKSW